MSSPLLHVNLTLAGTSCPLLSFQVRLRISISIIGLKGVWIVPLKSRINLQTRLEPLLKFQRRIILAKLVLSGEKTQNICQ
jgi:hypothetical protein